ncbi:MAG TPA: efflux RND transporter permease subunit [Bacillota bacterium]
MSIGVTSNMKSVDFSTFLTNYIEPQLSKKSGVAQINLIGNADREIQVNVANQKLQAYGISNSAIATAIQNANLDYPTGSVKDQDGKYTVRLAGTIKSIEQLKKLNVPMTGRFSYRMLPMLKMVVKSGRRSVGLTVSHL